ncbi:hypothetical protein Q9L58_008702 [Maublancomyces gigas]|uniref:Uncharacterized protein n=1 Tax=Discina gigas TaxID=1032678 RepID=A0ABR3G9A5_9PEZI
MMNSIVLNKVMESILAPLQQPEIAGVDLDCADRKTSFCFPVVCAWVLGTSDGVENRILKTARKPIARKGNGQAWEIPWGALTAAVTNTAPAERLPFTKALHCTHGLVDFQLARLYRSLTETTFGNIASYHAKFEKYRNGFLEFRVTQIGKATARRVKQVLRQHQSSVSAASQSLPTSEKREREAYDKLEKDEHMQDAF